jgi:hypothetical protein
MVQANLNYQRNKALNEEADERKYISICVYTYIVRWGLQVFKVRDLGALAEEGEVLADPRNIFHKTENKARGQAVKLWIADFDGQLLYLDGLGRGIPRGF